MNRPLSVWASGQTDARTQRADRYLPETITHPARMLPDLAAAAITTLTRPGDLVLDPMCGAGTSLVEALRLGRAGLGIDIEARWAALARDNITHTTTTAATGAAGTAGAEVFVGDARDLPRVLGPRRFAQLRGQVRLLLTSPPYGAHTHGQVTTRPSGVVKTDFRYSPHARPANLAHQHPTRLLSGLTQILAASGPLLAPDAHVVITARPWREHGELIDLPGAITTLAPQAGLRVIQRCVALLAGVRDDHLVTRASFFQRANVGKARAAGHPWQLLVHEDVLILAPRRRSVSSWKSRRVQAEPKWVSGPFSGLDTGVRKDSEGVAS